MAWSLQRHRTGPRSHALTAGHRHLAAMAVSRRGSRGNGMATTVDLIVLGTGSAAQTVASTCRDAGRSVAVVDSRPFGGTCALRGCDPKKVLVGVSVLVDWSRRMQGKGITAPGLPTFLADMSQLNLTYT